MNSTAESLVLPDAAILPGTAIHGGGSAPAASLALPVALTGSPVESTNIPLSDLVSALSFALDLTEDAAPGHAVRCCLIGMQIAASLGLDEEAKSALYYALLLKDIGCSSNSARMCQIIGGDDRWLKGEVKLHDWTRPTLGGARMLWNSVLPGSKPVERLRRMLQVGRQQKENSAELIGLRCERGANIVAKVGLSASTSDSIRHLDEHWNGSGYPDHLKGDAISIGARILNIAQHLDVFHSRYGADAAIQVIKQRSARWFDPELVGIALSLHRRNRLLNFAGMKVDRVRVMELAPATSGKATASQLDTICEAFADVVDAKSSFTYEHSVGVTRAAGLIARQLGLSPERQKLVYRAALLHDIGKLRVPNSIIDKPGKLDNAEWIVVREHPGLSRSILERVKEFEELSTVAGQHHEKLDGSGYPDGASASALSIEARIIAVADVYGALSESRPYRGPLLLEEIVAIMSREVPGKLDRGCFDALLAGLGRQP